MASDEDKLPEREIVAQVSCVIFRLRRIVHATMLTLSQAR